MPDKHKKMGTGIRILTAFIAVFTLAAAMRLTALAKYEDKIFYLFTLNDNEEVLGFAAACMVKDTDGSLYAVTDASIDGIDNSAAYFVLSSDGTEDYQVEPAGQFYGDGLVKFEFQKETPSSEYFWQPGMAQEDQTVKLVYVTYEEGSIGSVEVKLTEARESESNGVESVVLEADGLEQMEMDKLYVYPMLLIDDDEEIVGIRTLSGTIYSFLPDADAFEKGFSLEDIPMPVLIGGAVVILAAVIFLVAANGHKAAPSVQPSGAVEALESAAPMETAPSYAYDWETPPMPADIPMTAPPQPISAERNISITGVSGYMSGRSYQVGENGVSIGREVSSNIRYPAETKGISRSHCRLFLDGRGELLLMDCGSSYGTFLKGYGKLPVQKPVPVKDGDIFYLGSEQQGFTLHIR